jgi:hypothetical protein
MAIKNWTARTIRRLWLGTAVVQVALLLPGAVRQYRSRHPATLPPAADSVPGIFTGRDSAARAELLAELRDSLGIILEVRGDTITDASLTPEGEAELRALAACLQPLFIGMDQMYDAILPVLLAVLLLALSPTLIATALTIYWLWALRRRVAPPMPADR